MSIPGAVRFRQFFRAAARLQVDDSDLSRYVECVNERISALLIIAEVRAKASGRDVLTLPDLPITKGLQERIREFKKNELGSELGPLLHDLVARPPLDVTYGEDVEQALPTVAGGLSLALARSFAIVDPVVKNPDTDDWSRVFRLFELLL
jgi:hypothetical protein